MTDDGRGAPSAMRERRFDMRELWRVGCWGIGAAGALSLAVLAGSSGVGSDRLALALAQIRDLTGGATGAASPQLANAGDEAAARRVAEAVRGLAADRERLAARIASIESSIGDLTGSIARAPSRIAPQPAPQIAAAPQPPPAPPAAASPPAIAHSEPAPIMDTVPEFLLSVPVPRPSPLLQPPRAAPESAPRKPEFGIDLGSADTVEGVRALWAEANSRYGPALQGLRPIMTVRQNTWHGRVELRLVVGPLPNQLAASRLCATFSSAGVTCEPAAFDGQRLAARP